MAVLAHTVTEKDGVLAATWTGPQGRPTADAVTFSDPTLRFTLEPQDESGSPVDLRFQRRITGDKIEGHLLTLSRCEHPTDRQTRVLNPGTDRPAHGGSDRALAVIGLSSHNVGITLPRE